MEFLSLNDSEMEFGESLHVPKYESSIPKEITDSILQREKLPELPKLKSSIVEDFIFDKIEAGIIDPEIIAQNFLDEGGKEKLETMINEVKEKSQSLDWEKIFTIDHAKNIQGKICEILKSMGADENKILSLSEINVDIRESMGPSGVSSDGVYVSRLQVVRKAMDYVSIFGDESQLDEIVKIFMSSTIGHELGHKINSIMELVENRIDLDKNWEKNGSTGENRSERFAEFWGMAVLDDEARKIKNREWLVQLKIVNRLWEKIDNYNLEHDEKIDLAGIFNYLSDKVQGCDLEVGKFIKARNTFYGGSEVENYASPYSQETVEKAIKNRV